MQLQNSEAGGWGPSFWASNCSQTHSNGAGAKLGGTTIGEALLWALKAFFFFFPLKGWFTIDVWVEQKHFWFSEIYFNPWLLISMKDFFNVICIIYYESLERVLTRFRVLWFFFFFSWRGGVGMEKSWIEDLSGKNKSVKARVTWCAITSSKASKVLQQGCL